MLLLITVVAVCGFTLQYCGHLFSKNKLKHPKVINRAHIKKKCVAFRMKQLIFGPRMQRFVYKQIIFGWMGLKSKKRSCDHRLYF